MNTRGFTTGVGGRLLLSFLGIGLFSLIAATSGFFSLSQVGGALSTITEKRMPQAVSLLELSQQAERVVRAAPALLAVQTDAERISVFEEITRQTERLNTLSNKAEDKSTDAKSANKVKVIALVRSLNFNLTQIEALVKERLAYTSIKNAKIANLTRINGVSKRLVSPGLRVLDAQSSSWLRENLSETTDELSPKQEKLAKSIVSLIPQQKVGAVLEAVYNGLLELTVANSVEDIDVLMFPLQRSLKQLIEVTNVMPKRVKSRLEKQVALLVKLVEGSDSLDRTRRLELNMINQAKEFLAINARLAKELTEEVNRLVKIAIDNAEFAKTQARDVQSLNTKILAAVLILGFVFSILIVWLYVGRRIIARLSDLISSMISIANGDLRVNLPASKGNDEITQMEKALTVFRDTAIEVEESNLRDIETAQRMLTNAIESTSEGFAFFDHNDCMVISNSSYAELLFPEQKTTLPKGIAFMDILDLVVNADQVEIGESDASDWVKLQSDSHINPDEPLLQKFKNGNWVLISERKTGDGGTVAILSDITDLKKRETELASKSNALEQLSNQLAKYLSPQVYDSIFAGKQEVKLVSERKRLTVFFSDIAGFTSTTEKLESEDLTQILNHYLTEMSQIAIEYGATIDKYIGDAIVIFFGDPETLGVKEDAIACVKMAIAMRKRMIELEHVWKDAGIENPLRCRMGINTGMCTVGNFGSDDRMDYTIIGSDVNLAARLESSCPINEILISFETYAHIKGEIYCEEMDKIKVKGFDNPIATYRVVDLHENVTSDTDSVHESGAHFNLDIELDSISKDERKIAVAALSSALKKLSK